MKKRSIADLGKNCAPVTPAMREAELLAINQRVMTPEHYAAQERVRMREYLLLLINQPFVEMRENFEKIKASPQWRAMEKLQAGLCALRADTEINVSESCADLLDTVLELLDRAGSHDPIDRIIQPLQKHFDHVKSSEAAEAKYANDPKQAAKVLIKNCWEAWQNNPRDYDSKEDFAKDMKAQFPILKSIRKITNWCREWEAAKTKS